MERYNRLFKPKRTKWKVDLSAAVTASHMKLAQCYSKTEGLKGTIYNLACILDPMQKLDLNRSPAFESHYAIQYGSEIRDFYKLRLPQVYNHSAAAPS